MLDLKDVTLVALTNMRMEGHIAALKESIKNINFGDVKLISEEDKVPSDLPSEINFEKMIYPIRSIDDYSFYMIYNIGQHIETTHMLIIQDHGFVVNPSAWTDEFLEYDYIGAPWAWSENAYIDPFGNHQRVGNGGVSLRSKKLMDVPNKVVIPWDVNQGDFYKHMNAGLFNEDGNICVHNKHLYEEQGCKYAPVEVAAKFSYERDLPENKGLTPFVFHYTLPPSLR